MDDVGWLILSLCVLAPVSVFFALNALALRCFRRLKLQDAFQKAGKKPQIDEFIDSAETLTLTSGLMHIVTNTAILFVFISLLRRFLFQAPYGLVIFFLTACIVEWFALLVLHTWAKHTAEVVLSRTYTTLKFFAIVAKPALVFFNLHDELVRRLAGVQDADPEQVQEERQEEILSVVEQGRIEGVVDEEEMEMIENVLELDETAAEEIMTPRTDLIAINLTDDLNIILETIRDKGHSRIPVYEETIDNIIGLVYAKDLLSEIGKDIKTFDLKNKIRDAYFVPESKPLRDLLHEFQNQKLHIAVVLDEYGGTAGIVTIEDILEELVGEITDEFEKTPTEPFKKIDAQTFEVDARMYIDDVNEELEIELPEDEDYDTIGGFVFSHLGYIPKVDETFDYEDLNITVTATGPRAIKKLRIKIKPTEQDAG
ncbi:MAG: HlyC/CorC family transporter [Planctomycetes bacterium]|nr:HlyC/CorC family transporter [Planctomycetota bacterium]